MENGRIYIIDTIGPNQTVVINGVLYFIARGYRGGVTMKELGKWTGNIPDQSAYRDDEIIAKNKAEKEIRQDKARSGVRRKHGIKSIDEMFEEQEREFNKSVEESRKTFNKRVKEQKEEFERL